MREERAQMKKMMPEKNAGQIQKHEVVTGEKLESNKTQAWCTPQYHNKNVKKMMPEKNAGQIQKHEVVT